MIETTDIIIRLASAALCGGVIGLERERKEWAAGMRTHMMVAVGSALYMIVSTYGFSEILKESNVTLDPSRIAAQVVSGIGFLGAGTIIFLRQGIIRGLTTASGLWTVAAIGLAIGSGMFIAGVATTIIAIVILWLLQPLERYLFTKKASTTLVLHISAAENPSMVLDDIMQNENYHVHHFSLNRHDDGTSTIKLASTLPNDLKLIASSLSEDPRIRSIEFGK